LKAMVTGATGGLGRALVQALVARGHEVLATDVARGDVPSKVAFAQLDVTDAGAWEEAARWQPDVLFQLAAVARAGAFVSLPAHEIDRHIDINLKGAALGMRTVLPGMVERGRGHVVNVGSLAGVAAVPGIALYSASKFALRGLSLAVATELRGTGVAITLVEPDLVATPMITPQIAQPEAAVSFSGGRVLAPEEVAEVLAGRVLRDRPLEVLMPRRRGALAKVAGAWPELTRVLKPVLRRKGEARQAAMRGGAA